MRNVSQVRVDQRGFTLAELLVAIAIVGLVMTGLLTLLMAGNQSYLAGANQVEAQAAVRAALERMTQEIREAGYNPKGLPPCTPPLAPTPPPWPPDSPCMDAIINATATSFTIQNDWNGNSGIEAAISVPVTYSWAPAGVQRGEQVTYSIDAAGNLTRLESGPAGGGVQVVVQNVGQAAQGSICVGGVLARFQYCDANGNVTGVAANIRTVIVNFQGGVQGQTPGSWQTGAIQVTMSDRIRLRNRIP